MNKTWSDVELNVLRANSGKTDKEIEGLLKGIGSKHTFQGIRKQRQRMGLKKEAGRRTLGKNVSDVSDEINMDISIPEGCEIS